MAPSIVPKLFRRKSTVDGFEWLAGQQELKCVARRNKGVGYLSAILAKAVVATLRKNVVSLSLLDGGGILVDSQSQTGHGTYATYMISTPDATAFYLPYTTVTYHMGLLALAEALFFKREAEDLLDTWEDLLSECRGVDLYREPPERVLDAIGRASDELYYWLRYREKSPEAENDRLDDDMASVLDFRGFPYTLRTEQTLDGEILTDLDRFRDYRALEIVVERAESVIHPSVPGSTFLGPQLAELMESLKLGMNVILIGRTSTGKTLCYSESIAHLGRKAFVLEGHESMKEFDLLGCYVPVGDGVFTWEYGLLPKAMREGTILVIDEANRMPTRTLNVLLGAISRRKVVLTEHGSEEVEAKEGFQVIMACNMGKGYAVNAFDEALVNRFECILEFRYLPPHLEEQWLVERTGLDRRVAQIMVKVASETRAKRRARELAGEITPRGLLAWARKFQARESGNLGERLKESAKVTFFFAVCGVDADGMIREDVASEILELIEAAVPA